MGANRRMGFLSRQFWCILRGAECWSRVSTRFDQLGLVALVLGPVDRLRIRQLAADRSFIQSQGIHGHVNRSVRWSSDRLPNWAICACLRRKQQIISRDRNRRSGACRARARGCLLLLIVVARLTLRSSLTAEACNRPGQALRASAVPGGSPMTTMTTSTALATIQPVFTDAERLASAVHQLVPRPVPAAVLGPPGRHRSLRPRAGGQGPRPRHRHPAAVHHRRPVQVRRRGRVPRPLPGGARAPSPAGL